MAIVFSFSLDKIPRKIPIALGIVSVAWSTDWETQNLHFCEPVTKLGNFYLLSLLLFFLYCNLNERSDYQAAPSDEMKTTIPDRRKGPQEQQSRCGRIRAVPRYAAASGSLGQWRRPHQSHSREPDLHTQRSEPVKWRGMVARKERPARCKGPKWQTFSTLSLHTQYRERVRGQDRGGRVRLNLCCGKLWLTLLFTVKHTPLWNKTKQKQLPVFQLTSPKSAALPCSSIDSGEEEAGRKNRWTGFPSE